MTSLYLRKVQHSQAPNNFRVVLKTDHAEEFEVGSIGVPSFTSRDIAWTWGIDTVLPLRTTNLRAAASIAKTAWPNSAPHGSAIVRNRAGLRSFWQ